MLIDIAKRYARAGISVIPIHTETKKPKTYPPDFTWKRQQNEILTEEEIEKQFDLGEEYGIAVVTGKVSGGLEVIDFDNHFGDAEEVFREFIAIDEVRRLIKEHGLPYEKTKGGGYHLLYRCGMTGKNTKLAQRPKADGTPDTLIETRGEGGYCIVFPTTGYHLLYGDLEKIPMISEAERGIIHRCAKSWDEAPRTANHKFQTINLKKKELSELTEVITPGDSDSCEKIWEKYNRNATESEIKMMLEEAGWRYAGYSRGNHKFRRPGKVDDGISATFNGEVFYCFSSAAYPFEAERGYSKFNVFKMLRHGNDFRSAIQELEAKGYVSDFKPVRKKRRDDEGFSTEITPEGQIEVNDDGFFIVRTVSDAGTVQYKLKLHRFIDFLAGQGFRKFIAGRDFIFVRVTKNIVEEVQVHEIQNFCQEFIRKKYESLEMMEKLLATDKLWTAQRLAYLPTLEDDFNQDTLESAWLYFTNYAVEVKKGEKILFWKYDELPKPVWKRKINKREIAPDSLRDESIGEFERFIENVSGGDAVRKEGLMSAIGYLLHSYKNPSQARCIIFMDERIPEVKGDSNGGTGKSLVGNFIMHYKNVAKIGVNDYRLKIDFLFEPVDFDTEIVIFDDANYKFPFDFLFPYITGSLEVNKKNKSKITIPFSKSPKFLITTNHTIGSSGVSAARRKYEIEFADYYNEEFTPFDEFGHNLFSDWNEEEKVRADVFAIRCLQHYLETGLYDHENVVVNSRLRQVIDKTSKEFVEFMQTAIHDGLIISGEEFNRKELFEKFRDFSEEPGEQKLHTFSKWISMLCQSFKWRIKNRVSHNDRFSLIMGDLKRLLK